MCKFFGKILTLTVLALLLNAGAAVADPSSSDWNNSWGFISPLEKANMLNQALAIELVEDGGFNVDNYSYYGGDTIAIGSQVIVDVDGDNNHVNGNDATNDGNTSAQSNNNSNSNNQSNDSGNSAPY
jgi:hypothetical protein